MVSKKRQKAERAAKKYEKRTFEFRLEGSKEFAEDFIKFLKDNKIAFVEVS